MYCLSSARSTKNLIDVSDQGWEGQNLHIRILLFIFWAFEKKKKKIGYVTFGIHIEN